MIIDTETLKPSALVHAIDYKKIKVKSTDLKLDDPGLFAFVEKIGHKMVKTCLNDGGIGLAAPQIGIFKRMFVIRDPEHSMLYKVYINPTFKSLNDEKKTQIEGCLSVVKSFDISRFNLIEVNYWCYNENNELVNIDEDLMGLQARVFQHELDHLNGVSIAQLAESQQKKKFKT